jgi:hypothetical protein
VLSYQKKLFYLRSENNLININFLGFSEGKCIQKNLAGFGSIRPDFSKIRDHFTFFCPAIAVQQMTHGRLI